MTEAWTNCQGDTGYARPRSTLLATADGLSNTLLMSENAGREDVWRGRLRYGANADQTSPTCARGQGGAWATNDSPFAFGAKDAGWCTAGPTAGAIPTTLFKINGANDQGWLVYSFHDGGANAAFGDGSVRFLTESTAIRTLGAMATRSGGETVSE
jgi:prepilin-type processing-associated H-X9-DG protein